MIEGAQQMFISFFSFFRLSAPTVACPCALHQGSLVSFLGESLRGPGSKASNYSMQLDPYFCFPPLFPEFVSTSFSQ